MNSVPPRLRPDLEIKSLPATDGPAYVVKDPSSGEFYRLREAEHFIALQFDGNTSLEEIRERAEKQFDAALSPETLAAFVRRLHKSHLLETPESAEHARKGGLVRGGSLYMRIKLCDPDRLLARLAPRLEFLFTRWFLLASGALILLALATTIGNRDELAREVEGFLRPMSIPFVLLVLFTLVSIHEFAHGLACKRYGGGVHEMGFMLIYFQPALYCNVSDAWLFPERRQRLVVQVAGPYVELTLWAAATVLWRLTDAGSAIHGLALIVAGSAGIKTLLNFNPLMKYDGYYMLSDLLDVPNLRTKSFRYIGALVKRFFGRPEAHDVGVLPRLQRIYLWYGISAVVFSYSALAFAILIVGDYFIENRGPVTIVLACLLVAARTRSRIARLFGPGHAVSAPVRDTRIQIAPAPARDADTRARSTRETGTRTKPAPSGAHAREASRPAMEALVPAQVTLPVPAPASVPATVTASRPDRVPTFVMVPASTSRSWAPYGIGALVVLALLFLVRLELRIAGPFNVLPQENSDVRSPLEQIIEEIYVDEGQKVKPGDRIARLDDRPLRADLATTEAAIQEELAILHKLQVGPTTAEIDVARAGVAKGRDTLTYAKRRAEKLAILYEQGLVSQKEMDDAEEQAVAAANNTTEAGSRLRLLQVGTRPEEIAASKAKIEQLEAQRRYLEEQRALLDIVSPVAGVVATPTRQLKELRRQVVKKGDLIVKVYDMSTVTAQIFVSERELDGIRVGERVELRARAYPGTSFHGKVTSIATSAVGAEGTVTQPGVFGSGGADPNKTVLVTTQIDNPSLLLKPEMTGQAKIFCGSRTMADLIARRMALTFRVALWSWW